MINVALFYNSKNQTQGGGFTFQEEILNNVDLLKDKNISYTLICTQKKDNLFYEKHRNHFKKFITFKRNFLDRLRENLIRNFSFFSERSRYITKLDRICSENEIDLVLFLDNVHTIHTNFPFITIVYDIDHLKYPFFPEYSKDYKWYKRENSLSNHFKRASGIISGTDYGIDQIKEYYGIPKNKLFKIPHPVINLKSKKNDVVDDKYIKNKFLFYPAQFWPHKNHKSLINLGKELKKNFKNDLKIVFSGSDKGNLNYIINEIKKNDLENTIVYLGFINQNQLYSLYKSCFALTYVSYGGPENLPPIEAFSLGCPVIATNHEGSREQLEDGAILIDPNNLNEFLNSINKLKDDKFKFNLLSKGYSIAEKRSINSFMTDLKQILFSYKKYITTWKNIE